MVGPLINGPLKKPIVSKTTLMAEDGLCQRLDKSASEAAPGFGPTGTLTLQVPTI